MLGIGPKIPVDDINYSVALNNHIKQNFPDSAGEVSHVADSLTSLRKQIYEGVRGNDDYATVKPKILKYISTLEHISKRFTFAPPSKTAANTSITIPFSFHEVLDGYNPVTAYTLDFEIGAALWNLAALATRQAVDKKATNLVEACTLFRESSGTLEYILTQPQLVRLSALSNDFAAGVLSFFARFIQAQAQMCLFEKAVQTFTATEPDTKSTISPATVAQFAAGASDLYRAACAAAAESGQATGKYLKGTKTTSFDWMLFSEYQRLVSLAAANMWWGRSQFDAHKYGMEILYLSFAVQFANQAAASDARVGAVLPTAVEARKDLSERVQRRRAAAMQDNNVVYFDHVPNEGPAVPAKIMATPVELKKEVTTDPYQALVDPQVMAAVGKVRVAVEDALAQARAGLSSLSDDARARLSQLGLPARVTDARTGIPDEVWSAVTEAGGATGVSSMEEGVATVQSLAAEAGKAWARVSDELDEEEKRDKDLKQRYPGKVHTVDSKDLNGGLKTELARVKEMLEQAAKADDSVRREVALARSDFPLLGQSRAELEAAAPAPEGSGGIAGAEKENVKRELAELSHMLRERDEKVAAAEAAVKEWSSSVLSRVLAGTPVAEEEQHGKRLLAALDVAAATAAQNTRMQAVTAACAALDRAEGAGARTDARRVFLNRITAVANTCRKVRGHVAEGARFYEELMREVIGAVSAQATDFIAARDLERRMVVEQIARAYAGVDPQQAHAPAPTAASAPQVAAPANTGSGMGGYGYGYGNYGYNYGNQQ